MTSQDFASQLRSLNVGMTSGNYDRYKLIALHKNELGASSKRGASVEEIVSAIFNHRNA